MMYLDTGCLLKLYYPEPESPRIVALVQGQAIVFASLHELEFSNALQLKLFRKEARPAQVRAIGGFLADDLRVGALYRPAVPWDDVLTEARGLAATYTRRLGCRSLDILHCALARRLVASSFVTTDSRQRRLALAIGLDCPLI